MRKVVILVISFAAGCALIDAASGTFEQETCAFVDCACVYETGCDPKFSCDAAYDCTTCEEDDDCENSICGIDGVCLGCQGYIADFATFQSHEADDELYQCQDDVPNPTCIRDSCLTY